MTKWTYARIDRFESGEVRCVFCNRALRSGRLIVLQDEVGKEACAGSACAKKHLGTPTEALLDLSKIAMQLVVKEGGALTPRPDEPTHDLQASKRPERFLAEPRDDVAHYLRLRVQHMAGFKGNTTDRLRKCYAQLTPAAGLGEAERLYVTRLLVNASTTNSIYSLRNVETCIGAAYWICLAIDSTSPERRGFLEGMLRGLRKNWRLSAKQIEAINRWGEVVRKTMTDFPKLDPSAFSGVQPPKFVSQNRTS